MSFVSRAWMAESVAVVQGNTDQRRTLASGLRSIQQSKGIFPGDDFADIRTQYGSTGGVGKCNGDERRRQTEESLHRVMYLNCWGQG